ncbi:amidohydrolase family protein [Isoptericola cucumis]|uniref:Amidohydrolase (Aminocarboxymuconate-semialdehyde decarboxylase) n=1 Tax=Isoptericola cucumis TaxID=1776856 RepID=A0ABQ2AZL0_9MICO|nr:amidohydrolase family protein [Isoptericola cucumis]GGI04338.1 putative amidohydrolase (aminocarboxymuconate-semialdehyde decarboxylase) [Isoptericola cucumis]
MAPEAPTTPSVPAGGAVDTHAHVYPAVYLDRLERIGVDPATTAIARGLGADSTDEDVSERLRDMDRAGVGVQVLAVTPQSPGGVEPGPSLDAARWVNDEYARLLAAHPDRFAAYGALPLPHVAAALAEIPRLFDELGFAGVSLPTVLPGGRTLADPRLDEVWSALDERSAVVNLHATGSGARSDLITDHGLVWVNGAPVEDAVAVLQLLKADLPRRFPRVRLHVAHLAGDLPFLAQRLEDNYEDWGAFPSSPLGALRRMWFDAANFHEPSLALAVETLGASRILAGSDHPYFRGAKYRRAFDYVRTSRLAEQDVRAVLHGNARALYGAAVAAP